MDKDDKNNIYINFLHISKQKKWNQCRNTALNTKEMKSRPKQNPHLITSSQNKITITMLTYT